jgi:D-sedoheptulose 7-phosphate isomerase
VLADARESTLRKCADVIALRQQLRDEFADQMVDASMAMASAFTQGGKLLSFGNGGSATDAQDAAVDCLSPPLPQWRPLPALALTNDIGVVTGVANDVGFDNVFTRQIIALGEPADIALGFSTSGSSPNVLTAFREARRGGMLCIAFTGNDGGQLTQPGAVDYCFIGRLEYIPRIQEGHATLWHTLLELTQACLASAVDTAAPKAP